MAKLSRGAYAIKISGLTLIEVLIALAIVAIALAAVIKATAQNIRGTNALENKITAMWVGSEVMNEARVGLLTLPGKDSPLTKQTQMLDRAWYWQAYQEKTPNSRIIKVVVNVFANDPDSESAQSPIFDLESYVYHAQ